MNSDAEQTARKAKVFAEEVERLLRGIHSSSQLSKFKFKIAFSCWFIFEEAKVEVVPGYVFVHHVQVDP